MTADVHMLTGAYVVHALPTDEQAFFERHLGVCEACRVEVDGFLSTAAILGSAPAEPPPPGLREEVLSAIDVIRQSSPVPPASAPPRSGGRVAEPLLAALRPCWRWPCSSCQAWPSI